MTVWMILVVMVNNPGFREASSGLLVGECMNKIKLLIPIVFLLLNSGCASFGPTVRIETSEPAEDFVVVCEWYGNYCR